MNYVTILPFSATREAVLCDSYATQRAEGLVGSERVLEGWGEGEKRRREREKKRREMEKRKREREKRKRETVCEIRF